MNLLDILRGLVRRWYITVPGILLTAAAVVGGWQVTPPEYSRSASQLMLPGEGLLPDGATNRFLYVGGLTPVADVLVRSVNADEGMNELRAANPGADFEVVRDVSASGPVIVTTVTAPTDAAVEPLIEDVLALTEEALTRLQRDEGISARNRVTLSTIAVDQKSDVRMRDRMIVAGAAGVGTLLVTLLIASITDGILVHARRRSKKRALRRRNGPAARATGALVPRPDEREALESAGRRDLADAPSGPDDADIEAALTVLADEHAR